MTISMNPAASEQAFAAMRAAFESLPNEILLKVQSSVGEALTKRAQAKSPESFLVNLCTGELPGPGTIESGAQPGHRNAHGEC